MANQETKEKAIAMAKSGGLNTDAKASNDFATLMKSMESQIKNALPKHLTVERMMRVAMTAYSSNPKLRECDPRTIIAGVMQGAQMGLEVNTALGQAYLIPFKNNKTNQMEAQFQTGYRGELSLAYRSGLFKSIMAYSVYPNDDFEYQLGLEQKLKHVPARSPDGEPIYYYAVYKTTTGGEAFYVMSREQVDAHAKKFSMAYQKGWTSPWKSDFDSMAKKTCLKQLLNYAPKTIEYERAFSADGSIKTEIQEDMTLVENKFDFEVLGEDGKNA